ncbi:nitroreductase family protein [Maribellus sp. YY47]|uniref:nitroreductase family protein n=1 Tax=Maribellus sp. YY47 TaxID=2929486 RepID=UPI002000D89F|nr:nitroreductase family protein [Maribellus sp. YY47]MCK3686286.1 nitroreductase family protein [Maribellus sp. YY47]
MIEVEERKQTKVNSGLHPLIQKRWSPRAFSEKKIEERELEVLFEAASWAPSANNEQPWQYVYALKGTPGYENLWNCLMPGNQPWSKTAPVIFAALYRNTFKKNGMPNPWAAHDLGMANAQLLLQAASSDIYGHLMAGFDEQKLREKLQLRDDVTPVCVGVLGYLGNAEKLDEPYRTREIKGRSRYGLNEFVQKV